VSTAGDWGAVTAETARPHSPQNSAPSGSSVEQFLQFTDVPIA
jgi:hypothetical protein